MILPLNLLIGASDFLAVQLSWLFAPLWSLLYSLQEGLLDGYARGALRVVEEG